MAVAQVAPFNIIDMHTKAIEFTNAWPASVPNTCTDIYRNTPQEHFNTIIKSDRIMRVYFKDRESSNPSGDRGSPINKPVYTLRPKGLFFCANVRNDTGMPPICSPFGNTRLSINIDSVINISIYRLFFADFYCFPNKGEHYVTLVVTKPASTASKNGPQDTNIATWCEQNLLELEMNYDINEHRRVVSYKHTDGTHKSTTLHDVAVSDPTTFPPTTNRVLSPTSTKFTNPFFYHDGTNWKVSSKIWVEILYTEDVCIDVGAVSVVNHFAFNQGTAQKDYTCGICNSF